MKVAVLASHEGTTLQAILDACATGQIPCRVVAVISNNPESGAIRRAQAAGVPVHHLSSKTHPDPPQLDAAIAAALAAAAPDVIVLAGYMKLLGPRTLSRFRGRVLNTHPALLPKFGGKGMYGLHVHRAVLAVGERTSGATVHVVTDEYDAGPIVAQCDVPVEPGDTPETLAARVQPQERALLVRVLSDLAAGRLSLPSEAT
jgi:phosphoribosylglycinamide formyltransferase-1